MNTPHNLVLGDNLSVGELPNRLRTTNLCLRAVTGQLLPLSLVTILAMTSACSSSNNEIPVVAEEGGSGNPSAPPSSDPAADPAPPTETDPSDDSPTTPPSSVLNKDNQIAMVGYVFSVYSGTQYDERLTLIPTLIIEKAPDAESVEFLTSPSFEAVQTIRDYTCDNSGKASSKSLGPTGEITEELIVNFLDCEWQGSLYDGELTVDYSRASPAFNFEKYSIVENPGSTYQAIGTLRSGGLCEEDDYQVVISNLDNYEQQEGSSSTTINGVMTRFGYGNQCLNGEVAVLEGSFSVRSNETGSNLLEVSTPVSFKNAVNSDRNFPVGSMLIRAADDSEIGINADNGDVDTVTLTLTVNGVSEITIVNWTVWQDILTF